ncbi:MAG: hypothetical protein JNM07_08005 [Phycisphaerae bacterium]|nr:hypothetical protein [Phycisphaerae bacterium]
MLVRSRSGAPTASVPSLVGFAISAGVVACATLSCTTRTASSGDARPLAPEGRAIAPTELASAPPPIDLTRENVAVWGSTDAEIIDTTTFPVQIQIADPWRGEVREIGEMLPEEGQGKGVRVPEGPANDLVAGGLTAESRVRAEGEPLWPAIGQTPWTPPDPTLAVGPNHVVVTVNMAVAFYDRSGTLQFSANLDNTGNPGFFETVGGGNFVFDPKCFYDHFAQRFVIIAPEYYSPNQSWVDIAVSDDSNPNGTWYKYRTNSVVTVGASTYWVDYPGLGYDQQAYYVTGNLFGLNTGGTAGTFFRVFNKAPLLSGGAASFSTLRDANAFSVQVAQHFGATPIAPYFVSTNSSTSLRVHAITNPLTSPALVSTTVTVPSWSSSPSAANSGGSTDTLDGRIISAHWRAGRLYAGHTIGVSSRAVARWYQLATNNWPTSGSVSLTMSGNIDGGSGVHTFFPSIYSNKYNDVAVIVGRSTAATTPAVAVTGRRASDAAGTMGALTVVKSGASGASGRWGDYFDAAVDPRNDIRFWGVGEVQESGGWSTWVQSWLVSCPADFNHDGSVDDFDYFDFLNAFNSNQAAADYNKDGTIDDFDYFDFLNDLNIGC